MWTYPDRTSKIVVSMKVQSPNRTFKKGSIFGLGWGISYGKNLEKTESLGALYVWDQDAMKYSWFNLNMKGNMTLDEIRNNPGLARQNS